MHVHARARVYVCIKWGSDNYIDNKTLFCRQTEKVVHTLRRSSFLTALMLSLEAAPSGQFNRAPRLKYFEAELLRAKGKYNQVQ